MTLRRRLILSILAVVAISGGVSTFMGGWLLWHQLGREAENRVRQDLNAAREFYNQRLSTMDDALQYTALGERFSQAVATGDIAYLTPRLDLVSRSAGLDLLTVTDPFGRVIYRAHRPDYAGDSLEDDPLVRSIVAHGKVLSGTMLVPLSDLEREDPVLAERAKIPIVSTARASPSAAPELKDGMMLCSAAPVRGADGKLVGVLRAGILLNGNHTLVDQVQNTVFRDERYRDKPIGTATIFQHDVRISTNVRSEDGERAVGTRVSAAVRDHVLGQRKTWVGPAWVVNDKYIAAYEPICDVHGQAIGMLYVGVLERKFSDLTLRTLFLFFLVTLAGLGGAGIVGWKLAGGISHPIRSLASASSAVAQGEFSQTLPVESDDEIGSLTRNFNTMARSLKEREELLKEGTRLQLTRSERLAAVGRLAAGVAHEINNPLTGVLTFAHILHKNAPEGSREKEDIETLIAATTRCKEIVRGLLNFSRQSEPQKTFCDLNGILRQAINLTRNQALLSHVTIVEQCEADLPPSLLDANQIEQVAVNVIVNAIDAMPDGGRLTVSTRSLVADGGQWVEFAIADTGCGIPEDALEHIFDPFFTTKPTGKGTGLGLAIAYGIVAEHGGRIHVSSEVNQRTVVAVRLPATSEA